MSFKRTLVLALLESLAFGSPEPGQLVKRPPGPLLACNSNNCYRVMFSTPLVASSFCSKYIQVTETTIITPTITISNGATISPAAPPVLTPASVPAHIATQCQLTTSPPLATRLSSACSCISVAPSPPVTATVQAAPVTTVISGSPAGDACTNLPQPPDLYYAPGGDGYALDCGYTVTANDPDDLYSETPGLANLAACIDHADLDPLTGVVVWDNVNNICRVYSGFEGDFVSDPTSDIAILVDYVGK